MENRLKQVLEDVFEMEPGEVTPDSSPESVVLWDSLHHLKMVSAIEKTFHVKFSMKEIRSMTTFARIHETLGIHLDGKGPRADEARQG